MDLDRWLWPAGAAVVGHVIHSSGAAAGLVAVVVVGLCFSPTTRSSFVAEAGIPQPWTYP